MGGCGWSFVGRLESEEPVVKRRTLGACEERGFRGRSNLFNFFLSGYIFYIASSVCQF